MVIRESAKHVLGMKDSSLEGKREPMLTNGNGSSLVVDRLCDWTRGKNTPVTCFYFDFAARKEQSAASMLGSLLKQIIDGTGRISEEMWRALREQKEVVSGRRRQLIDIVKMLQLITSSRPTYMCIDALDECTAVQRFRLFDSLKVILEKSPGVRVFVTGRPHIQAEIEKRLAGPVASISIGPIRDDIVSYLRVRLSEDETPDAMDERLEADILERIPENVSEMCGAGRDGAKDPILHHWLIGIYRFLLVSLNINSILQESTIHRRRERLSKITDGLGLGDVYDATIERIKAQDGDKARLGMGALMWISHAELQLTVDELCHALAIELRSTDFNLDNVPSMSTLLSCCQGLITVEKEAPTVRLIHFTLKEYLAARPEIFGRYHSTMAEMCLTYLNSETVKALSIDPPTHIPDIPFLEYCSLYWGVHAKRDLSEHARSRALELFQDYDGHISAKSLLKQAGFLSLESQDIQFSGLHCASFFGIVEVVAALIEIGNHDTNQKDFLGHTPLAWAARNGHEEVVKILLREPDINPDKPDNDGATPLLNAAWGGYGRVVKLLLECGKVNPDKQDNYGQTPLHNAALGGHEEIVKMLLERDEVNPDKPDDNGRTPLRHAAWCGYERVVKLLLERDDVYPDQPDDGGQTPLSHAARGGYGGVVKALLRRGEVSPDKSDNDGKTPLQKAADGGHEEVIKILLELGGVNPDKPDNVGRTPLWCAAWMGYEGVAKILLGREEVNPDRPDEHGNTPLSAAAQCGHEDVVSILLGTEGVNPENQDNDGDTTLSCAAFGGCEGVVKLLLEKEGVNPDKTNHAGQTPLLIAAREGHAGVVQILLKQEEVNPNKPDNDGRTPFMHAARHSHERVIALLQPHEVVTHGTLSGRGDTHPL